MKYKGYTDYEPSSIKWFDVIPSSWQTDKLKRVCLRVTDGAHISPDLSSSDVPFVSTVDIVDGEIDFDACLRTSQECYDYLARTGCQPHRGDVLFSKDGTVGKTAKVDCERSFVVASSLVIISPNPYRLESRFLNYWLNNSLLQQDVLLQLSGAALRRISVEKVSRIPILLPPLAIQRAIADFLDAQTVKIDTLLAKKRVLLEKLKEKRAALISQTVTRGLPPEVARATGLDPHPMLKPSGIDWLGEIPNHWEIKKLGYLAEKIGSGKTPLGGANSYVSEGICFLRSQNIYDEGLMLDYVVYISEEIDEELKNSRVKPRDILLNITGASLGRTCLVPDSFPAANVNQHVCIIRLREKNLAYYISWALKSSMIKSQIDAEQTGAAREGFNFDQISKLKIALPPYPEQKVIIEYLREQTEIVDQNINKVGKTIKTLAIYRTALITAAVTGKIDVREVTA